LNLPETGFPMRAGLPEREPQWLARWARLGIYDRLRSTAAGRPPSATTKATTACCRDCAVCSPQ